MQSSPSYITDHALAGTKIYRLWEKLGVNKTAVNSARNILPQTHCKSENHPVTCLPGCFLGSSEQEKQTRVRALLLGIRLVRAQCQMLVRPMISMMSILLSSKSLWWQQGKTMALSWCMSSLYSPALPWLAAQCITLRRQFMAVLFNVFPRMESFLWKRSFPSLHRAGCRVQKLNLKWCHKGHSRQMQVCKREGVSDLESLWIQTARAVWTHFTVLVPADARCPSRCGRSAQAA